MGGTLQTKTCTKCREIKPIDRFYRTTGNRDGRTSWCSECCKAHQRRYREVGKQSATPRICRNCGKTFIPPERRKGERGQPPVCCSPECQHERTRVLREAKKAQYVYARTLKRYNLTDEQYKATLAAQGGRCAGCGSDKPGGQGDSWKVDHDHSCCPGKRSCGNCVRGLVCNNCNLTFGLANDDPAVLRGRAEYLERARQRRLVAVA